MIGGTSSNILMDLRKSRVSESPPRLGASDSFAGEDGCGSEGANKSGGGTSYNDILD